MLKGIRKLGSDTCLLTFTIEQLVSECVLYRGMHIENCAALTRWAFLISTIHFAATNACNIMIKQTLWALEAMSHCQLCAGLRCGCQEAESSASFCAAGTWSYRAWLWCTRQKSRLPFLSCWRLVWTLVPGILSHRPGLRLFVDLHNMLPGVRIYSYPCEQWNSCERPAGFCKHAICN